ncbi:MAG TPA: hypothetical protein VK690_06235, partial [Stellaceae bacterium]|nr:hypothetical protein [Stellaceae bacterium]
MADIIADTMPWEPPESARQPDLGAPSLGEKIGAQIGETSAEATGGLARALYQGQYEDSWWGRIARGIALSGAGQVGLSPEDIGTTADLKPVAAPKVTAEEANKRYAPLGPDGQPVKITDQDLPEPVAASLGEAKAAELDRARVLGAYGQQNAWPTRFATGTAAFLMDPINLGSLFLPGVGEETMLAQMGRVGIGTTGLAARTLARAGAGASAGFIGQAALEPLRYGLAQENDADYSTRQAFINLMYGAAGGAVISAGVGALGDAFRATSRSPAVKADAMRAATSQMVDGRPIDVGPAVDPQESPSATATAQQQGYRNGFAQGIPQDEFDATKEDIYGRPGEPQRK